MGSSFSACSDPKALIDKLFDYPRGAVLRVDGNSQGRSIIMAAAVLKSTLRNLQRQDDRYAGVAVVGGEKGDAIFLANGINSTLRVTLLSGIVKRKEVVE